MRYSNTLIAVKDMGQSLRFYRELFEQEVAVDLGWCKTLSCGLTLQERFDEIAGFPADTMKYRPNTMERYFETEDFEAFLALLEKYPDVERLHEAKTYPWLQRGIHIFDPNGHLIEVAESMYSVACRLFKEGKSVGDAAELLQHPQNAVEEWFAAYGRARISVCGTDCGTCYCYGEMCSGCTACEGKVFHMPEGTTCKIYECVCGKNLKDCGGCEKLPCDIWRATRDPKYTDEEFEENIAMRAKMLKGLQEAD